ncbi:MAG: FHA domain-containing protein [Nitrospira sp.]|nr:FHA domain-containing protein [Nitrospira sp.]
MDDSHPIPSDNQSTGAALPVVVRLQQGGVWSEGRSFTDTFTIGRAPDCDIVVNDPVVSRHHAEVRWQDGVWRLVDLGSRNGTYLDGVKIQDVRLPASCRVTLGQDQAVLSLTTELAPTRFLDIPDEQDKHGGIGPRTRLFQVEIAQVKQRHYLALGLVASLLIVAIGIAFYQHYQLTTLTTRAEDIFYAMKRFELRMAELERRMTDQQQKQEQEELRAAKQGTESLAREYDELLAEQGLYARMRDEDQAVLRVVRRLGECETAMPPEFLEEVHKYIHNWQTTPKLHNSMQRALASGYTGVISNAMLTRKLPKQLFYVALQESGFNPRAIGKKTAFGYAKGMWQFIPSTATRYKLKVGPLHHLEEFDPDDERFDPIKSTHAAAEYLKDIYLTDAQASGLLVIASYNWGEQNILKRIRELPKDPRERNFWQLMKKFTIPKETHDYVFHIIAAAVIGENPQLFGFRFPAPFSTKPTTS